MLADSVIKDFDIFKARGLHFSMGSVAHAVVSLVLEAVEPALGRRVIPAISLAAHRARHAERLELVGKGMTGILAAAIRMMHHT